MIIWGASIKQKICIVCDKPFTPKSNRSIRCIPCQTKERKKQKARDRKKAKGPRTLDGRAYILEDGTMFPISHEFHESLSQRYLIAAQMAGYDHIPLLVKEIRHELKYEQKRRNVWNSLKFGMTKSDILKKYKLTDEYLNNIIKEMKKREEEGDETDRIRELRTAIVLINDWYKIAKKQDEDKVHGWEIERALDEYFKDINDIELFEYQKHLSPYQKKTKVKLNKNRINKLDKRFKPVIEYFKELTNHLIYNKGIEHQSLPEAFFRPLERLLEYRMENKHHSL